MVGVIIVLACIILGVVAGINIIVPYALSQYVAVAILAFLDSAFGGMTANMQKKFDLKVFLTGFFGNAIIAMILVFIGIRLNVDIYLAAVIVFSTRLLNNFSVIRRIVLGKVEKEKKEISLENNLNIEYEKNLNQLPDQVAATVKESKEKAKKEVKLEKLDKGNVDVKKKTSSKSGK